MMMPKELASRQPLVDVTAAMAEHSRERSVSLKVVAAPDPFAEVEV
jgi:hypothetical protein